MRSASRLPALCCAMFIALSHGAASAVQDCDMNGESVNPSHGGTTAGKSGLMRCKDRDTGVKMREQQLQNGVFMGVVRYFEEGKLIKEHSVNATGNMHGVAREFTREGKPLFEATYDNGSQVGLSRSYYPAGPLRRATFYADKGERASVEFTSKGQISALRCGDKPMLAPVVDDARLCGFSGTPSKVEFFDDKGTLRQRVGFVSGKRVRNDVLYENGQPSFQDEIVGNQRIERRWSADGAKRRELVSLIGERGSVKRVEQDFSEKGTLVREQRWTPAGEAISDQSYYLNGQPRSKSVYAGAGEARTVEITDFADDGQRAGTGTFSVSTRYRQTPVGVHQRVGEQGLLRAESTYDDKGRVTRERSWDAAGKPERDDEVFEDGSRRAYSK